MFGQFDYIYVCFVPLKFEINPGNIVYEYNDLSKLGDWAAMMQYLVFKWRDV